MRSLLITPLRVSALARNHFSTRCRDDGNRPFRSPTRKFHTRFWRSSGSKTIPDCLYTVNTPVALLSVDFRRILPRLPTVLSFCLPWPRPYSFWVCRTFADAACCIDSSVQSSQESFTEASPRSHAFLTFRPSPVLYLSEHSTSDLFRFLAAISRFFFALSGDRLRYCIEFPHEHRAKRKCTAH